MRHSGWRCVHSLRGRTHGWAAACACLFRSSRPPGCTSHVYTRCSPSRCCPAHPCTGRAVGWPFTHLLLQTFLQRRRYVLSVTDDVWEASIPRVDLYKWLIEVGAGAQHVRPLHALLLDHNAGVLPIRSFDLCWCTACAALARAAAGLSGVWQIRSC